MFGNALGGPILSSLQGPTPKRGLLGMLQKNWYQNGGAQGWAQNPMTHLGLQTLNNASGSPNPVPLPQPGAWLSQFDDEDEDKDKMKRYALGLLAMNLLGGGHQAANPLAGAAGGVALAKALKSNPWGLAAGGILGGLGAISPALIF
jgi:hypothetical protein